MSQLGWFLLLTNNTIINFGAKIISNLSHIKYNSYKNPDELLKGLKQIAPTLSAIPETLELKAEN